MQNWIVRHQEIDIIYLKTISESETSKQITRNIMKKKFVLSITWLLVK